MNVCPHCNAELVAETLTPGAEAVCPSCGAAIAIDEEGRLSSLAGGSPADATMRLATESDSSLAGSSLAGSAVADDKSTPGSSADDVTIDSRFGELSDAPGQADEPEATLALGDRDALDVDEDFSDSDFELSDDLDDDPVGDEGPSASLDATIDLCDWAREEEPSAGPAGEGATIDLAGPAPPRDATQLAGSDAGPSDTTDETLPVDSDRPGSSGFGASGQGTDPPTDVNDATLAFDSERRSGGVDTPEPIDITGLGSGATMPVGPLAEGRASQSLRPGDSMLVGSESVRLRVSSLSEQTLTGERGADFAIEGEAGKGGMGVVYKARQQSLDRLVALKQIKSEMGATDSDRDKFVSEAVITGQLEHPNIAPVHDLGLAPDGLPFYAMKFVEGEDWEDSIKDKTEEENLAILIQVAQAIAFAHSKNVLHRDLKPGNVRLGAFGEVLVMDWGLAARTDDGSEIQPAGTPIYMPPETALEYLDYAKGKVVGGKKVASSRRRIPAGTYGDVYLLGALLFKIVTGRAPHRGKTTFECLRNAAKNEIVKTRRTSELLDIAYKAMATEPEDRHGSAIEFIDAVRAYQSHAQSIQIAKRASQDLREAGRLIEEKAGDAVDATKLYALFSSAQNGYKNALELWDGNRKAQRRLLKTQRMFAEAAYGNGDYDLALSLLDDESPDDASLRESIVTAQSSRNARLAWFRTLQYATAASLLVALGFIAYSFVLKQDALSLAAKLSETEVLIEEKTSLADRKQREANVATRLADEKQQEAAAATERAEQAEQAAAEKRLEADRATKVAAEATQRALTAEQVAAEKQQVADRATEIAAQKTAEATEQSYYAALGRLRAVLADEGAYAAWKELRTVDPDVVARAGDDPEWRYLVRAVEWRDEAAEIVAEAPEGAEPRPTFLASSPNVFASAVAEAEGTRLSIYRGDLAEPAQRVDLPVVATRVAMDREGCYSAVSSGALTIVENATGSTIKAPETAGGITCLAFNPASSELLVGDDATTVTRVSIRDGSAELVDADQQWHQEPVTAVGYSMDGVQRFSADGSGRIVVWRLVDGEWADRRTIRHRGSGSPRITVASLASDPGGRIAYGCDDGSVYELAGWWDAPLTDEGYAETISERLTTSHPGRVTGVEYAQEGRLVLSSGGDTMLVRAAPLAESTATDAANLKRERRYHAAGVTSLTIGGNGMAISADQRGRIVRWKIDVNPDEATFAPEAGRGPGVADAKLSEQDRLVVADSEGFVRQWWDLDRPSEAEVRFAGHADHREFRAWRLDLAEPRIVTAAADNRVCVWRERDGLLDRTIDLGNRTVLAVDEGAGRLVAASDGRPVADGQPAAVSWHMTNGEVTGLWEDSWRVSAIMPLGDPDGTLAIGLRDGQVFLWNRHAGRRDLARSSGRPHWRTITAIGYDPSTDRLFSGDRGGLLAAWDLASGSDPIERPPRDSDLASVVRLEPWRGGVLSVSRTGQGLVMECLGGDLQPTTDKVESSPGLTAVAVSGDRLIGVRNGRCALWNGSNGWRNAENRSGGLSGVRAYNDGLLTWGPGRARWLPTDGEPRQVVSRPSALSLASIDYIDASITNIGSVDRWPVEFADSSQARLGIDRPILASVESSSGEAIIAIDAGGSTDVERWDLASRRRLGVVAEERPGKARLLALAERSLAIAFDDRIEVQSIGGAGRSQIRLEAGSVVRSIAIDDDARRVAFALESGAASIAERDATEGWAVTSLGRTDVTAVAFPPGSDRLLLGVTSGRVLLVETPKAPAASARTLLSLDGHSDAVTLLRVSRLGEAARVVSGDAAGRVVVRSL